MDRPGQFLDFFQFAVHFPLFFTRYTAGSWRATLKGKFLLGIADWFFGAHPGYFQINFPIIAGSNKERLEQIED